MAFIIPNLQELLDGITIAREGYLEDRKPPNPERLKLFDILDAAGNLIKQLQDSKPKPDEIELQEACLGAYIFCFESIAAEYRLSNPDFKEGYLFNSGSKTYKRLLKQLGISDTNKLSEQENLIYLAKFYNFVFKRNRKIIEENLDAKKLDVNLVQQRAKATMKSVFTSVDGDAKKLIKAIPTELAIDSKMGAMLDNYLATADSDNPDRQLLTKIVVGVSKMIPANMGGEDERHFLSRTQRIKMGLLLYIMQSIWDSYLVRSPAENSALYDLCREALNIEKIEDIDSATRLACLTAFETFINDSGNVEKLEIEVGKLEKGVKPLYIDPKIHQIRKQIDPMVEKLHLSTPAPIKLSPVAMGMASLGALIAAAPGYGGGWALGYAVSQTNEAVGPKLAFSNVTGAAMTVIFQDTGKYLGYYAANLVVDATLERAFAKVFEALAMLVGASAGGLLGLVMYDLSYQTLRNLCTLYMEIHSKMDPTLANDADPRFIACLLDMPKEVFSEEQKAKVQSITQGRLFKPAPPDEDEIAVVVPSAAKGDDKEKEAAREGLRASMGGS